MKLSCKVVSDLPPLNKDEVCRDESKALVEEHLQECENCKKKNRKKIWIAVTVAVAVVLAGVLVAWFIWKDHHPVETRDISPERAVTLMPTVLITSEEYAVAEKLLQRDDIQAAIESNELVVPQNESLNAEFLDQIHVNGERVDSVTIEVIYGTVYVNYTVDNYRYFLVIFSSYDITKSAAQLKKNQDVKYYFENHNNTTFKEALF